VARLFVRLKLSLIAGGLHGTGGTARIAGLVFALLGALLAMPLGFVLLAIQHGRPGAANVAVITFTAFAAGWLVLPIMMFGADETLDPARLALLPLRPATLVRGLLAAALTGIGPVVTFVILCGAVVAVADGASSVVVGVLAVLIGLGLCVTGSRALVTALSGVLRSRRGRDLGVLLGGLVVIAFFAANMFFQQSLARSESSAAHGPGGPLGTGFAGTASVARWTPPGLVAHSVADAAAGRYGTAALELGAGLVTVVLLAWAWIAALRRALEHPDSSTHAARRSRPRRSSRRAAGVLAAVPAVAPIWWPRILASRTLAAAGKELRYYRRDPRRKQQLVSLVMPVLLVVVNSRIGLGVGMSAGPPGAGTGAAQHLPVWPAVLGGMIAGMFSSANQYGFDGSALWLNIVATSRWQDLRSDIAGKNIAGALITVPVFAVLYVVIGALASDPAGAAVAFAMAVCALGATSSVGSVTSVLLPTPIPERRSSTFSSGGAGQGCLAGLSTLAGLGTALALMIPVFLLIARWQPGVWLLVVAPGYGLLLAWAGRLVAATIGIRRLPELLARVSSLI
jgi:ABC-2 type transport system permease protein